MTNSNCTIIADSNEAGRNIKIVSKAPTEKNQQMLAALQKAVSKTLEHKRRLGHYAVLWKDGKIVMEGEDAPSSMNDRTK